MGLTFSRKWLAYIGGALTLLGGGGTAVYYSERTPPKSAGPPPWAESADQQAGKAPCILIGTVTNLESVPATNEYGDDLIETIVTMQAERTIRCDVALGQSVQLTVLGGSLPGRRLVTEHDRVPEMGERIRVLLRHDGEQWRPIQGLRADGQPAGLIMEPR